MRKLLVLLLLVVLSSAVFAGDEPFGVVWERPLVKGADELRVLDFSGDGVPEIYVTSYSTKESLLSCFGSNGSLLWEDAIPRFSFNAYPSEQTRLVRVVNFDGDAYADLIVGGEAVAPSVNYHPLYLAEREPEKNIGVVRIQEHWVYDRSDLTTSAELAEVYGNGSVYVIASSNDFNVYVYSAGGVVVEKIDLGGSVWDVHAVGVDGDPELELVAGTFEGIALVDNRTRAWLYPTDSRVIRVSTADLDGDSVPELVGGTRFAVYALNRSGGMLWTRKVEDLTSNIEVRDLEGDGAYDIIFGSGSTLNILDEKGNLKSVLDFDGRVNSVGAFDADGDKVLEVAVGLNDRVMLLKLTASRVKQERALRHYANAVEYYRVGEIQKAVNELEASIQLYGELDRNRDVENLSGLLDVYKRNLAFEGKIREAFRFLNLSRQYYAAQQLENASAYAQRAQALFIELNNSYGVLEAEDLVARVESRRRADALLAEAEILYVAGSFEDAAGKAREAYTRYVALNNTLGARKAQSIIASIDEVLKTTTVSKTTIPTATLAFTTTIPSKSEEWAGRKYTIYGSVALIGVMLYHVVKTTIKFKRRKVI